MHWANIITSTKYYTTPLKIERNMLGRFIDEKNVCNVQNCDPPRVVLSLSG
jgi:hypothetical protein